MKTKELIKCLYRTPLSYIIIRQRGSHRTLKSPHFPTIRIGYHDCVEVSGSYIKDLLMKKARLSEKMAKEILK